MFDNNTLVVSNLEGGGTWDTNSFVPELVKQSQVFPLIALFPTCFLFYLIQWKEIAFAFLLQS